MNYLNHLSLAFPDHELIAGNYIADLLTYNEYKQLIPTFEQGIQLHRWIDTFSNTHLSILQINKYFHNTLHKYAPVATDILCDYLLYLNWDLYFNLPYEQFAEFSYASLKNSSIRMPSRIAAICQKMIHHDWLMQYQSLDGIEQVLSRTSKKARFYTDLTLALPVFKTHQDQIQKLYLHFYSDCQKQSDQWLNLQNEMKS